MTTPEIDSRPTVDLLARKSKVLTKGDRLREVSTDEQIKQGGNGPLTALVVADRVSVYGGITARATVRPRICSPRGGQSLGPSRRRTPAPWARTRPRN